MVQNKTEGVGIFVSIPKFTKDKTQRAKLYRLIREHQLKEGEDFILEKRVSEVILVSKDLKV